MLGSIPIVSPLFQTLLDALGWVLATIYRFVPNYGVAIIILTLLIKFLLVPLGIKQIKSMQHMQAIQPKIKELQKKYKGNKAKIQEETMKLYKEAGVNPLGGCLPLLLQFPVLIAMYAVIRMPTLEPTTDSAGQAAYVVKNNHLPVSSQLFFDVIEHENTGVIFVNLQCSAGQSGTTAVLNDTAKQPVQPDRPLLNGTDNELLPNVTSRSTLNCGDAPVDKVPYFLLLILMIATTFYQQRQMTKAAPQNAGSSQQQQLLKFMPLMFGIFGFTFPAGLVLYWTVSNGFQIGQQSLLMRAGHIGPDALERRMAEQRAKNAAKANEPEKKGFMARMLEQQQRTEDPKTAKPQPKSGKPSSSPPRPSGPRRKPNTGGNKAGSKGGASGAAGDPKSRTPKGNPDGAEPKDGNGKGARPKKRPGGGGDGSAS